MPDVLFVDALRNYEREAREMNREDLVVWLVEEAKRADADEKISTMTDDYYYHQGEVDAYLSVLTKLGHLI